MRRYIIDPFRPNQEVVDVAAQVLRKGGVVLHPTETVYGLAVVYDNEPALQKVRRLKGRRAYQPFSIMINDLHWIERLTGIRDAVLLAFLRRVFPAPLTILLPRTRSLDIAYWDQFEYLGFRLPDHPLSRALVEGVRKPMITTSANRSGRPAPSSPGDLDPLIRDGVEVFLDGGETRFKVPSTIVQISWPQRDIKCIRPGAIDFGKIKSIFFETLEN